MYLFFFIFTIFVSGIAASFIPQNMERSAAEAIPGFSGGSSCCMFLKSQAMVVLGREWDGQDTFRFGGMEWEAAIFLSRLIYVGLALGVVFLAVRFFDMFDASGAASNRNALVFESMR